MNKDFIFICRKCQHNIFCEPNKLKKLIKTACPNCGEEAGELWILSGMGTWEKDKGNYALLDDGE